MKRRVVRMSISQILYKLFGEIEPYGDTSIDDKRYENIENYYEALSFIIAKLQESAKLKNRPEYSIKKIAEECEDILKEYGIEVE
jgi:hypothetical protein